MPSRTIHTADVDIGYHWGQSPYYEESFMGNISEPSLEWTLGSTAAVPSQNSCSYHDYASPFSSGTFDELPDITYDQTSPNTTNPTTPSSPSYSHFSPNPNPASSFRPGKTPGEGDKNYTNPRLLPKQNSTLAMALQHRLQGHSHSKSSEPSPRRSIEDRAAFSQSSASCAAPSLSAKRERSSDGPLDANFGVEDDECTPDPPFDETDGDGDIAAGSEPYAQLIYRALKSVPGHSMVLKDIYEWFEKNTDKPQTSTSAKGWQNSIRHNLSMNGAFIKVDQVPPAEDSKKGFIWVLADSALEEGVKSTTRYRKHNMGKKSCRTENPAPQRQASGAKGGKAAKKSAMLAGKTAAARPKRSPRNSRAPPSYAREFTPPVSTIEEYMLQLDGLKQQNGERMRMLRSPFQQNPTQSYLHTPSATPFSSIAEPRIFRLSDVVGVADLGHEPLFYDDSVDIQGDVISSSQTLGGPDDLYLDYHFDDITT